MAFVCVVIRTQAKILKTRYARSVVDRAITLQDLFCKFASGEFDEFVFNQYLMFRFINIWPKSSNVSLGEGNNV